MVAVIVIIIFIIGFMKSSEIKKKEARLARLKAEEGAK